MPKRFCLSTLATFLLGLTSLAIANATFTGKVVGVSDRDSIKVMR